MRRWSILVLPAPGLLAPGLLALGFLTAGGCTHYQARPLHPEQSAAALQSLRLQDVSVGEAVRAAFPKRAPAGWPPAQFTPDTLLLIALVRDPQIAAARADLDAALGAAHSAREAPNLTLSLSLERYLQSQAGSTDWLWGIGADLTLSDWLNRPLQGALADAGVRNARLDLVDAVWKTRQQLMTALIDHLVAKRRIELATAQLADAEAFDTLLSRQVSAGEIAATERVTSVQLRTQSAQTLGAARQALASADAALATVLGISVSSLQTLDIDWPVFDAPTLPEDAQLAAWRDGALRSRSDIARALNDYDKSEQQLRLQVRAQYPQISLGPAYTFDHGVRKLGFNLAASIPLGGNAGAIATAEAQRSAAGARMEALQVQVLAGIDAAQLNAAHGITTWNATQQQTRWSEAELQRTERRAAAGAEDRAALINARMARDTAVLAELDALANVWQARSALEDALRTPLSGDGEIAP